MIISANDQEHKSFRTVTVRRFVLRVSGDGTRVELEDGAAWHELPQIPGQYGRGYVRVRLPDRGTVAVHKLVALAWHGPAPSPEHVLVEHVNGDRRDNRVENVRWATFTDNLNSAFRLRERELKYPVKLNEALVYEIRKSRDRSEIATIADEHGTGDQTVRDVFDWNTWRHVRLDQPRLPGTT